MAAYLAVLAALVVVAVLLVYLRTPMQLHPPRAPDAPDPDFVAAPHFVGARPGFVFTTRERGTGYYRDHPPSI